MSTLNQFRGHLKGSLIVINAIWLIVFSFLSPHPSVVNAQGTLSFTDISGVLPPNTGGHGTAFSDVDGDGLADFYMTYIKNLSAVPDFFFHNLGNGGFQEEGEVREINDFNDGGSHGVSWADLDNDGDFDLLNGSTTPPGFGHDETTLGVHNDIYKNDGNGFFVNVTPPAMLNRAERTRAIIALDWDKDGDLDIFAIQGSSPLAPSEVYRNDGNFQFTELTTGGLAGITPNQGTTDTDFDGDGDMDIFAASRRGAVYILRNSGSGDFSIVSPSSIGILHKAGDGITTADVDNDGDLDLLLSGDEVGHLYTNSGNGIFTFKQSFSTTNGYMGSFGDLDNDGDLDLVFAGDEVSYLNDGAGNFTAGPPVPTAGINDPRSIAMSDIDNDGDLDFAIAGKNSKSRLIRNNFDSGNYLKIRLVSPNGQAGAFGAKVYLYPAGQAGGSILGMRESKSNIGYLGQDDPVLHFGLGSHTLVDIVVRFLDGTTVTQTNVPANQVITVDASGPGDQTPPSAPADLVATTSGQTIDLSWNASSDPETGIASYKIYRDVVSGGQKSLLAQLPGSQSAYQDTATSPNTTYYYEVSAVNGSGLEGDRSNEASATSVDLAPSAPVNLQASAGDNQVDLDWDDNPESDLSGYNLYRSDISGGPYTKLNANLLPSSEYLDTAVVNDQTYYYVVTAVDIGNNESPFSAEVSATPSVSQLNPVAHWKLDDGSGTIAVDSAGSNDGTLINDPTWTSSGILNGALDFDGMDDRVTINSSPDLEISSGITLSAWVNADMLFRKNARIISKSNGSGANRGDYYLMASTSTIEFAFYDAGLIKTTGTISLTPGQWYHLAGTYDGSTARLYLNGVEVASTSHTGLIRVSSKQLHLGSWGGSDKSRTWDGRLDELRVYAQALSAQEILGLYNGDF